ncbi:SLC25A19 [Acanthosepion pharaonis]|uniref:SLC25A19 n=1 Tax=Acanthosepion pharaonis TaxID=158019 RepID=A0A812ETK4_ACAPH|nr:SLC25A19 [Sepia pharaonis]
MLQPLDVIKIRLQLQVEPVSRKSPKSKYFGFSHVFSSMLHEEGIRSLWKGHIPAQFLTVFYGLVQFSSFEFFTKISYELMPNHFTERLQPVNHMICGSLAGGVSTIVVQPMDVIRTRFIAQGEPKIYNHFHIACIKISLFTVMNKLDERHQAKLFTNVEQIDNVVSEPHYLSVLF